MALKVIKINLNYFETAQDLLFQTVREEKVNVVLVADQYRNLDGLRRLTRRTKQPSGLVVNIPSKK